MCPFISCWVVAGLFLASCFSLGWGISQPIGIDFGPEFITAAYAHSLKNVTILAQIRPQPHDAYHIHMVQLRKWYWKQRHLEELYGNRRLLPVLGRILKKIGRSLFSKMTDHFQFLENPVLLNSWENVQSYWALVKDLELSKQIFSTGKQSFDLINSYVWTQDDLADKLDPADFEADFLDIFIQLKNRALQDHNVVITHAIIAVPEYFEMFMRDQLRDAGLKVGIEIDDELPQRTMASIFHGLRRPGTRLPSMRVLAIDLGTFYLDLRVMHTRRKTYSGIKDGYLPMDPWRTDRIDEVLTNDLVRQSASLQFQVSIGAEKEDLWPRVKQARYLIRNPIDNDDVQPTDDGVYHHDEYGLDLEGWGYQEFDKAEATVSWVDVQTAEKGYVSSLGKSIRTYLISLRMMEETKDVKDPNFLNEGKAENTLPLHIDKVVLLTAGLDGLLLRQAVQQAIGYHVNIVGGTRRNYALAAEGSARLAWSIARNEERESYGGEGKSGKINNHDEL